MKVFVKVCMRLLLPGSENDSSLPVQIHSDPLDLHVFCCQRKVCFNLFEKLKLPFKGSRVSQSFFLCYRAASLMGLNLRLNFEMFCFLMVQPFTSLWF